MMVKMLVEMSNLSWDDLSVDLIVENLDELMDDLVVKLI
jgi:hypothetical protein